VPLRTATPLARFRDHHDPDVPAHAARALSPSRLRCARVHTAMSIKPCTSVVLTEPQMAFLKAEAARLGATLGELVRRIVGQYREAKHDRTS
jgi:hypothetical protein